MMDASDTAGTAMPLEERLESTGGVGILIRSWQPAGKARGVVVIVPGFNSHGGYYLWAADQLTALGFATYTVDLRGRGKSDGERFYVQAITDYVADVAAAVETARARQPGLPVFLFGHSAGGVVACLYALDHQAELAGLICESFAFQVPAPDFALAVFKGLSHVWPHAHVLHLNNAFFSRDPAVVAAMNADPLIAHETQPTQTLAELVRADEALKKSFPSMTLPLMIMHGICLDLLYSLRKEYVRLSCYASMQSDLDTRDTGYLAMDQEMGQIGSDFSALCSFIEPEILRIGAETIERFLGLQPQLAVYRHIFDDILRKKNHTRDEGEEKIIAEANLMADSPVSINNIFSNADFPYPEVTLEDETTLRLDPAAFSLHRRSPVREHRRKVFSAFLGKVHEFRRTFGAQLSAEVRKNLFFTRARSYGSCLERALNAHNIPVAVYKNLISGVRAHLDTLHRYLRLRKKLLGLEDLHYYDLYAPVVKEIDLNYSYEEGIDHVTRLAEAPWRGLPGYRAQSADKPLDRCLPQRRKTIGRIFQRKRLRRPSLHAPELQRQVR